MSATLLKKKTPFLFIHKRKGEGALLREQLVNAHSHCSTAMGASVFQLSGLEEVLHGRFAVWALHRLRIMVDDDGIL